METAQKDSDRANDPYWMQRLGGKARAKKLSKKRLSEIGRLGGRPRKKKARKKK